MRGLSVGQRLGPRVRGDERTVVAHALSQGLHSESVALPPDYVECSMSRGLDHIVHAVADLDAAAALYRRLGFTVGARNVHAWGTHNHIVQLPGFFIELLAVQK